MEAKIKHLEFVQAVISRMSQNSFLLKGWCVTLISALYALAAKDADRNYLFVSYIAIPAFWILDGFFIAVERRYRSLYAEVAKRDAAQTDFDLDASRFAKGHGLWIAGIFSKTLLVFYPFMMAVAFAVTLLTNSQPKQAKANKALEATMGALVLDMWHRSPNTSATHPANPPLVPPYGQDVRQMLAPSRFDAFRRPRCASGQTLARYGGLIYTKKYWE
jgi:hypothetical protein